MKRCLAVAGIATFCALAQGQKAPESNIAVIGSNGKPLRGEARRNALLGLSGTVVAPTLIERKLAPRSALLTGTADKPSVTGEYVVEFPPPNQCTRLGKIPAGSRAEALYIAVSKGGFSLAPAIGGLTVWTIEEWDEAKKSIGPAFFKQMDEYCAARAANKRTK